MRAVVVALGDLGRSARMRYHAQALAAHGVDVDLVGFEGTPLGRAITGDARITVHRLSASMLRHGAPSLSYAPVALVDAARISFRLWTTLRRLPRPDLVLVQNPPAFPTLVVTRWALKRKGVRIVIDWHNIGYTLLALRVGQWHPAVRLARWLERHDARQADASLCVSRGLAEFLKSRFGLSNTHVLYDRPASIFAPVEHVEREHYRQALFSRLGIHAGVVGIHRLPHELDGRRGLRCRHRRRAAPRGPHPRLGDGEPVGAVSRSRDSRDRRRCEAHRVRAPVRGPACAACAPAHPVARAGRLPARGRQRRPGALSAPVVVRSRYPDEGGGPLRRRRAGLRARLRGDAGRARQARHQRPAVFHGRAALERPVRFLRRAFRQTRRSNACGPARASRRGCRGTKGGRARRCRCSCPNTSAAPAATIAANDRPRISSTVRPLRSTASASVIAPQFMARRK